MAKKKKKKITVGEVLYYCDPDRNHNCPKTFCYINDGPCKFTKDYKYMRIGTMPIPAEQIIEED